MTSSLAPSRIELTLDAPSGEGASIGRDADGRAIFAFGGLPGETVLVELESQKKRFAKGRVVEVLSPAPGRRAAVCETARRGCGGCDLAHATLELQHDMKRVVVGDALTRIGRISEIPSIKLSRTVDSRYRTTLRVIVTDGQAGYRRHAGHDAVAATECLVAHPLAEDLVVNGRWGRAKEVTIRVSASTGERLAIIDGPLDGIEVPTDVVVTPRRRPSGVPAPYLAEEAGGRSWQISADSFFQAGPAAASALVAAVGAAAGPVEGQRVVDAYAGIGLFAGTVGEHAEHVTAIERSASSTDDARRNLGDNATVVKSAIEAWHPLEADIVIADPSRDGLRQAAVDVLAATRADRFVLVSCDPGAMGRDAGLLTQAGFRLDSVEIVDAFPDTSHVETVTGYTR